MKKVILSIFAYIACASAYAQTLTEIYVPQYFSGRTAATANNARIPVMALIQISGLTANTSYDIKLGLALTTEANTLFGGGSYWGGTSFGAVNWANAFTTDASGNSGPVWVYIQPTGNSTGGRFAPGTAHNLRYGIVSNGTTMPSNPTFVGTKTLTALDIGSSSLTAGTTDDGAFIQGTTDAAASGKFVLAYNNTTGSGDPIAIYRVRSHAVNQGNNSELPTAINDIFLGTTNTAGAYALLIPIGANNANGIRRFDIRNMDGTLFSTATDADGVWPSGANTTTTLRRGVETITSTDAPLPVQFKSFTASKANEGALLRWSTASELNNKGFEIQRSVNGGKYQILGFVKGAGSSNTIQHYTFNDVSTVAGTVCYRLKQVDFNGNFEFSKSACLTLEMTKAAAQVITTPNPFNGELRVAYSSAEDATAQVEIIDMLGKSHYNAIQHVTKGANDFSINTESLPNGIYFIRVTSRNEITTQRIIKK